MRSAMDYRAIPATEADPEPNPPTSGHWIRAADGSLLPADDATALSAGLMPAAAPSPDQE